MHPEPENVRPDQRVLWYARHAKAVDAGVCYGQCDVPVAPPAREAARALAESFPLRVSPCRVLSSPSLRCADVARELARLWNAELRLDERLRELSFGRWEGRRWDEIEATEPDAWSSWMRDWQHAAPPGGETPAALERRARSFLESLGTPSGDVLIAHAGFVRALEVVLFRRSWSEVLQQRVDHLRWMALRWTDTPGHERGDVAGGT